MQAQFRQRLLYLSCITIGLAIAIAFALYALSQNINLFYTPAELTQTPQMFGHTVHLGGYVKRHSVKYKDKDRLEFIITDHQQDITVDYRGVIPNLFREGQGVVVTGRYQPSQHFQASQLLAKHDAQYMPSWLANKIPARSQ